MSTAADLTLAQTCMQHLPEEVVAFMKKEWTRPSCIWQVKCTSSPQEMKFSAIDYQYTRERVAKSFALQCLEDAYGSQHAKLEVEMQEKAPHAFWHCKYDALYHLDGDPAVAQTSDSLVDLVLSVLQKPPPRSGGLWIDKSMCYCYTPQGETHPWDNDHNVETSAQYRVSLRIEKVCVVTDFDYSVQGCDCN